MDSATIQPNAQFMTPETFIGFVVIGLIAGALGKFLMPGKDPGGCFITMLLGIAGAFIGGFIANAFGVQGDGGTLAKLLTATFGSVVLLFVFRLMSKKKG